MTAVLCVLLAAFSNPSLIGTPVKPDSLILGPAKNYQSAPALLALSATPAAQLARVRPQLDAVVLNSKRRIQ